MLMPTVVQMARYFSADPDVAPNLAVARQWYGMAAERGVNEARYEYASMLAEGRGGDPDIGHALPIMEQAATEGYLPAYPPTAILYGNLPVDAKTSALAPEYLAKVYVWASAARARLADAEQIRRSDEILSAVHAVMPKEWQTESDRRVTEHVNQLK
jgi:TPR repeat protein